LRPPFIKRQSKTQDPSPKSKIPIPPSQLARTILPTRSKSIKGVNYCFLWRLSMSMRTSLIRFSLLILILAAFIGVANGQGVIIPGPCGRCPRPPRPIPIPRALPVASIKIDTKIQSQVATTHVEQVFRNDSDATLEGTYLFPIPESASIAEFAIWDGDRRLVGEVRSREEARRIYDEIVRRQCDPGLLEYAGKDLF